MYEARVGENRHGGEATTPRRADTPELLASKDGGTLGRKTGAAPTIRTGKPVVDIVGVTEIGEKT
jgi:hypothetical protein